MAAEDGFRIKDVWAFVAVGEDGDEGIMAMRQRDGSWMPMIAADEERIRLLRPIAEAQAEVTGTQVRLVRFHQRSEVETIG